MIRLLSHTETAAALDCEFRHAFAYTGHLTDGDALRPKGRAPMLRDGRAWGAGMGAVHSVYRRFDQGSLLNPAPAVAGLEAIVMSLAEDAEEQREHGLYDEDEHHAAENRLLDLLDHYLRTDPDLFNLDRLEHELNVPLPGRRGGSSSRYRLVCFFDGIHTDDEGRDWIVEFKLRKRLSDYEQLALSRQARLYAWAWERETGREVAGVVFDERLNDLPKPVKFNKDGKVSKVQNCDPAEYVSAFVGRMSSETHDPEVLAQLESKRWQARHVVQFRRDEMADTARQLVSIAKLVRDLDSGERFPVRNPSPMRCPSCQFRDICANPDDRDLIDMLYERTAPKRDRQNGEN